uniref:Uncharacterized protein n=1 Tax=Zea mays TaxID=4577 RepID=A0A804UC80_MAIZE
MLEEIEDMHMHVAQSSSGQDSMNPVMRSTAVRTNWRSRPLSVRPSPSHMDEATLPSDRRRLASRATCGGTNAASSSSSSVVVATAVTGTTMATGADNEPGRRTLHAAFSSSVRRQQGFLPDQRCGCSRRWPRPSSELW